MKFSQMWQVLLVVTVMSFSVCWGNVLIGLNGMDTGNQHGWRIYNFDGSYSGVEKQVYYSTSRYMAGWAIQPGTGFNEVTVLRTRSDLSNQTHYLTTYNIADGSLISSLASSSNGFNSSSSWLHHDATFMDADPAGAVYGYAVNKKVGLTPVEAGYGCIMDDSIGSAKDFGPYYDLGNSSRYRTGLAYDNLTQTAYLSTMRHDNGALDSVMVFDASSSTWSHVGEASVSEAWGNSVHIVGLSMGDDYDNDGDYDLYVACDNQNADGDTEAYNDGYNFWTVFDVEVVAGEVELTQLTTPFTVAPEAGDIYGIATEYYVPEPVSIALLGLGLVSCIGKRKGC